MPSTSPTPPAPATTRSRSAATAPRSPRGSTAAACRWRRAIRPSTCATGSGNRRTSTCCPWGRYCPEVTMFLRPQDWRRVRDATRQAELVGPPVEGDVSGLAQGFEPAGIIDQFRYVRITGAKNTAGLYPAEVVNFDVDAPLD